jgi:hypothetical protein
MLLVVHLAMLRMDGRIRVSCDPCSQMLCHYMLFSQIRVRNRRFENVCSQLRFRKLVVVGIVVVAQTTRN